MVSCIEQIVHHEFVTAF